MSEVFEQEAAGWTQYDFEELSIDTFREAVDKWRLFFIRPNELMTNGLLVDATSARRVVAVYDALKGDNQKLFDTVIIKDLYKFAHFLNKMWEW